MCGVWAGPPFTLVTSWGRSVHDDNRDRVPRRVTRRAALQLGAGAGVAAVAAPYVVRHSDGARAVDLSDAQPVFAPVLTWPVPPIVTRAQWGANEGLRKPGQIYDTSISKFVVHHTDFRQRD